MPPVSVTQCWRGRPPCKAARGSFVEDRPLQLGQDETLTEGRLGGKVCDIPGRGYLMGKDAEVRKSKATSSDCGKWRVSPESRSEVNHSSCGRGVEGRLDVRPWAPTLSCESEAVHFQWNLLGQSSVKGSWLWQGEQKGGKGKRLVIVSREATAIQWSKCAVQE